MLFLSSASTGDILIDITPDFLFIQIQGAIIVASLLQVVIGATGTMAFLLRFIGPLTITPAISLIGLSLFDVGADHACKFSNERFVQTEYTRSRRDIRMNFRNLIHSFSFTAKHWGIAVL
jgi:xanthine/uracil permease